MFQGIASNLARSALVCVSLALVTAHPAQALSTKECSVKYKAAKDAGTLGGKSWNDFRKAECGTGDAPAAAAAPAATTAPAEKKTAEKSPAAKPASPQIAAGGAVFPSAVAAKFSSEPAFKQRLHTCSEQYQANKATNANGGLRWIQKGGGYWSQCNARLKK